MKKHFGKVVAGVFILIFIFFWIRAITGPSPSTFWKDDLTDDLDSDERIHQLVWGSKKLEPLIAIIAKFPANENPFQDHAIELRTSEIPHAVYIDDEIFRAERNSFVLLANNKDDFVRIPIDLNLAMKQFAYPGTSSKSELLTFWQNHVEPQIK